MAYSPWGRKESDMTKHGEHIEGPSLPRRKVSSDFCPSHHRVGPGTESMAMARDQGRPPPLPTPSAELQTQWPLGSALNGPRRGPCSPACRFSSWTFGRLGLRDASLTLLLSPGLFLASPSSKGLSLPYRILPVYSVSLVKTKEMN